MITTGLLGAFVLYFTIMRDGVVGPCRRMRSEETISDNAFVRLP